MRKSLPTQPSRGGSFWPLCPHILLEMPVVQLTRTVLGAPPAPTVKRTLFCGGSEPWVGLFKVKSEPAWSQQQGESARKTFIEIHFRIVAKEPRQTGPPSLSESRLRAPRPGGWVCACKNAGVCHAGPRGRAPRQGGCAQSRLYSLCAAGAGALAQGRRPAVALNTALCHVLLRAGADRSPAAQPHK